MSDTLPATINVEPHPRLLSVLGDIQFSPVQCIAELVDNAFDEFLRHPVGDEEPTVWVSLPARTSTPRDGEVWIKDNGPGMTLEQLNNALRAGWTSNDRFGQLGLFGVGFNIATARLGQIAVVRSARADDPHWTVVTVDPQGELGRWQQFRAPGDDRAEDRRASTVLRSSSATSRPSITRQSAGTRRRSSRASATSTATCSPIGASSSSWTTSWSSRGAPACGTRAARSCAAATGFPPSSASTCRWLTVESVSTAGAGRTLVTPPARHAKASAWKVRERRIWGWVGIQRYLHASDFGIDFIRNGRKILVRDQSLFRWVDPDDLSDRGETEYPIEVPRAGRIVGEIHIDHVRVNYQKNAFEYDTPEWKRVVQVVRGEGPLQPKLAKSKGFTTTNTSPLARLLRWVPS